MNDSEEKLHVIPLDNHWEVETEDGTPLAREVEKNEAIEDAHAIAKETGVPKVILHDGDGVTEDISPPID